MSNRITENDLRLAVEHLNDTAGTPQNIYSKDENGEIQGNAGCYHLDYANGGVSLVQMCEKSRHGQGVRTIIPRGTKRELYNQIMAYIMGMREGQRE